MRRNATNMAQALEKRRQLSCRNGRLLSHMNGENAEPSLSDSSADFRRQVANRRYAQRHFRRPKPVEDQKLSLSYDICLKLGNAPLRQLKNSFEIPQGSDVGYLAGLVADFEQLLELMIKKPLVAAISDFQQVQVASLATESSNGDLLDANGAKWA